MSFRSDPAGIRGSITATLTPFTDDGSIDHESLRTLVRWQVDQGSHGVSIGGSTGEPSSQTVAERIAAMATVADEVAGRVPLLVGTGTAKLEETLELTAAARDFGADLALVITPYYARPTQGALYEWYATICREFPDLPIVSYNVPVRTAVEIAPETVARLRRDLPNFVGIKETTKDFEHFSRVIHLCGRDFLVWSGIELLCLPLLAIGGAGFISALTNIAPGPTARMFALWAAGERSAALDLHYALHPLVDLLFVETNPTAAKHVLAGWGRISSARVRPPLVGATTSAVHRIDELLREAASVIDPATGTPLQPRTQREVT
ncbi:MAG: 4-hydroxy-tetrahydrodipicolinate synthase [Micromonosporaceae bacterium]|jgi:4-hydroxy-tetrahydrodipicolinate synthase|nr:4-hydroxy-tetrahydrodipicolinate synthase [Micromonosporaceae bacterium]